MPFVAGSKPWMEGAAPKEILFPKGWLGFEERHLLYWLGKTWFSGAGSVIDAGAYAGASAFCLAAGLAESQQPDHKYAFVLSYDRFTADDDYVAEQLTRDFAPTAVGDNFLDAFLFQTGKYADRIKPIAGDFLKYRPGDDIEILFIDIAKDEILNQHVLTNYFPRLIPGRSIVVQQDFYQSHHPYIHTSMGLLSEYFELMDPLVETQSRVWILREPIPAGTLLTAANPHRSSEDTLRILDSLIPGEIEPIANAMKVARLVALLKAGRMEEAKVYNATLPGNANTVWGHHLMEWRHWFKDHLAEG